MPGPQTDANSSQASVLQDLTLVSGRLERALLALGKGGGAEAVLRAIAGNLPHASTARRKWPSPAST
ncbi:hypothetical protein D3872_17620 [Massilia cavernae]|uniref:Uncharacterized protein n=1 Tax=Massilia cavernae TaxID=2320864 RepID=A0A418XPY6_9BURK|nr:hypothetical protein D3872_17620 [Massilia cavernae]